MNFAKLLKETGCQLFLDCLSHVPGHKDLILSLNIISQLDALCGMQKLRLNGVEKVFKLQSSPAISDTQNRCYVIRPIVEEVRLVADQINAYLNKDDDAYGPTDAKFWIIFVSKLTYICDQVMEEEGILEYVNILECPLGLIPLEEDLYSMEDDKIFNSLYLAEDTAPLSNIVTALLQLQTLSGHIPEIHGQGKYAKIVADKLDQAYLLSTKSVSHPSSAFTDIYLIDRDTDFASLLLSQLNYEGIIDESFNICCCKIEVEPSVKHSLTGENDPIYRYIRDNHFSTVFSSLKSKNHEMKEKYSKGQDMNLSNLKNFVANELKKLQTEYKCLTLHISACEKIMNERNKYDFGEQLRNEQNILEGVEIKKCLNYLDKMILHQLNPYVPLRLLALLSLVQEGLPTRDYYHYLTTYCQNFGPHNMITFHRLKKLGLVTVANNRQSSTFASTISTLTAAVSSSVLPRRGNFNNVLKKFQLVPDVGETGYNIREPPDCAFVFGGAYKPMVCQLVDRFVLPARKNQNQSNLNSIELMKLLPGPNFRRKHPLLCKSSSNQPSDRAILIFFIGGVTYAEMTALRFLAKQRGVKIAVAATSIINGNRLMISLSPKTASRNCKDVEHSSSQSSN